MGGRPLLPLRAESQRATQGDESSPCRPTSLGFPSWTSAGKGAAASLALRLFAGELQPAGSSSSSSSSQRPRQQSLVSPSERRSCCGAKAARRARAQLGPFVHADRRPSARSGWLLCGGAAAICMCSRPSPLYSSIIIGARLQCWSPELQQRSPLSGGETRGQPPADIFCFAGGEKEKGL